jgi:hypothetical protein
VNGKTVDEPTMRTTLREPEPAPPLDAVEAPPVLDVLLPESEQAASPRRPVAITVERRSFVMMYIPVCLCGIEIENCLDHPLCGVV